MGKISILVILTIFTFHNIVGEDGVWETDKVTDDKNSLYSSLIILLIDSHTYNRETNYVGCMKEQLINELHAHKEEYENDQRLGQMTVAQYIADLIRGVTFEGPIRELELELISKVFESEIVVCDWTIKNIRIYRKGDKITQRLFFLYPYENHYDPLFKNDAGIFTTTFPLGDETDDKRYDDILMLAQDPKYFENSAASSEGANKRRRK